MYVSNSSVLDYLIYYIEMLKDYRLFSVVYIFFELLIQYLPYMLLSLLISTALAVYLTPKAMEKLLKFSRFWSIAIASILGAISPLSSYALIPFAGALYGLGLPIGTVSAFVLSTPLMNPTIFVLTQKGIGGKMALARLSSTLLIGIIGGLLADLIFRKTDVLKESSPLKLPKTRAFWPYLFALLRYMSKAFLVALFLASVIRVYVKPEVIAGFFGADKPWSIPLAALLGIPFYTCGGATIPIVSSLIDLGMTPSSALAFFIAGPATNIPNVSAVFITYKLPYVIFYLVVSLSLAVLSGYLFSFFI